MYSDNKIKELESQIYLLRGELINLIYEMNRVIVNEFGIMSPEYQEAKAKYQDLKYSIASLKNAREELLSSSGTETRNSGMTKRKLNKDHISIAVVEDDADDRDFICAALNDSGVQLQISTYANGTDFLSALSNSDKIPEIVLTDIRMPIISGFDVIQSVKSNETFKDIPVVVFSTSGSPEDVERAKALGASAYYIKPYSIEEYCTITDKILKDFSEPGNFSFTALCEKLLNWFRKPAGEGDLSTATAL